MRSLTALQQAFVDHYVETGGVNGAESARVAGYSADRGNREAYRLLRDPAIMAEIKQRAEYLKDELLPAAASSLRKILRDTDHPKNAAMVRWLYGTIGISPVTKSEHRETRSLEIGEDTLARAKRLAAAFGIDPRRLLGVAGAGPVIEGEAEVVPPRPGEAGAE